MVPHGGRANLFDAGQMGISVVRRLGPGVPFHRVINRRYRFRQGTTRPALAEFFLHPTGQIPAYEWNFSDVNPPVHAWASIFLYRTEQALHGKGDLEFLERSFRS
jgi:hypothetical protein